MTKAIKNYRQLRIELDELMLWFEGEELDLDEAVSKYEAGIKLIKELQDYLKTVENKIIQIKKDPK